MVKRMAKVIGRKVAPTIPINILVNTETIRSMASENSCGNLAPNTRVTMSMISNRATVRCIGSTEAFTEDFGKMVSNQASVL